MNDSPGDCQSRRTDRSIFSAEKMQDRVVQIPLPQSISATKKDIAPKTRGFLGFSSFFAVFLAFSKFEK
ncbi:MAG: hypothetical protein IJU96_00290, partial [Clostridia bacterium]|nr:hypothetical protein [Clostridia bacterium]